MSLKTVFQNFAKDLKGTMHTTEAVVDLIDRYMPDFIDNSEGGSSASADYSTTEHIVGKWIDGTTDVYERTFYATNLTITESGYYIITESFKSTDITNLISVDGGVKTSSGAYYGALYGIPSVNAWVFSFHLSSDGLMLFGTGDVIVGGSAIVTVRYTK